MRSMFCGVTSWYQVPSGCTHITGPPLQAAKQLTRLRLTRSAPSFRPAALNFSPRLSNSACAWPSWVQRGPVQTSRWRR